jgi:EPS-associated MarR family transcriptional regulator
MPVQQKKNYEAEESLLLLREIGANPQLTQRELSSRLGLSLGKINFLMKVLIEKGLIKVENFKKSNNKSAYLYYITPHGFEEKAKTTYRYLKKKIEEYEKLETEIKQLKEEAGITDLPAGGQNNGLS